MRSLNWTWAWGEEADTLLGGGCGLSDLVYLGVLHHMGCQTDVCVCGCRLIEETPKSNGLKARNIKYKVLSA